MGRAALATAALLVLAGCGGNSNDKSSASSGGSSSSPAAAKGKDVRVGLVFDLAGKGDKSFNDGADAGLVAAQKELGIQLKELTPNAGGTDREELLRLLASSGFNPVIGVGFAFADSLTKVAKQFPQTRFAVVDTVVKLPNVASLTFAAEQSSYLVGAAAAYKSKNHHVGFIGGVNVPLLQAFQAGFDAGARKVDPNIKIEDKYLTSPPDFKGFNDPAAGREAANGMYDAGADVIYAAAGGSGNGVFQAAKAKGTLVIGVDGDQHESAAVGVRDVIISSALKHVDVAVLNFLKAYVDGDKWVGEHHFDLKNDGVGYATSGGQIDDVKDKLEALKGQLVSGAITAPTTPTK